MPYQSRPFTLRRTRDKQEKIPELEPVWGRLVVGSHPNFPARNPSVSVAIKGFDTRDFVEEFRNLGVTPHVAQNHARPGGSAIDGRTARHARYAISQRKRKRIEECFGWLKTIALLRKVRHRGVNKVHWVFTFACAAYNLVRMQNLAAAVPAA